MLLPSLIILLPAVDFKGNIDINSHSKVISILLSQGLLEEFKLLLS